MYLLVRAGAQPKIRLGVGLLLVTVASNDDTIIVGFYFAVGVE